MGIVCFQLPEQIEQGAFLRISARIGGTAFFVESAFIADADALVVPTGGMGANLMDRTTNVYFTVTGDIEMISYVREAPVADVVPAAGLKIQPPPLRGGGAVDNNQGNGSHDHQIQAFRPSAPATAVATVIITFRISVQVFFFVFELIGILF